MLHKQTAIAALIFVASLAGAQQPTKAAAKSAPAIADNSFLLEEAYNQEAGIVQHISAFDRARDGQWVYAFTQEWPVPSQKHQFSYTVPVLHFEGNSTGIGDLGLNYRYQLLGADEEPLWFAPRLSVYLPTGDEKRGRGAGGPGIEVNLPLSYAFGDAVVTHWNAGGNYSRLSDPVGGDGSSRTLRGGASVIWLMTPTFNLMLESVATRVTVVDDAGHSNTFTNYVVSPGLRGAINFKSGLQIVPGIAMPIGVGSSRGERDAFIYLSFEHPFK